MRRSWRCGGRGALEAAQRRASMADGHPLPLPSPANDEDREQHEETLRECVDLLDGWGIQLKDPERGLIDFPMSATVWWCFSVTS